VTRAEKKHAGANHKRCGEASSTALWCVSSAALIPGRPKRHNAIGEIVKRYAAAAGYDPKAFAGHSLRAGFVTSALEDGADMFKVMDVTRHRRVETLKGNDRRAKALRNHAGDGFL
jgi:Phage integrase family